MLTASFKRRQESEEAVMKYQPSQRLYILNPSDLHRVDAAVDLLKQILEDIIEGRQIRVPIEPHSPGSLYELEEAAARSREERENSDDDF
jgi:hypothetical protein